ncbi:MAG: hypothetical protein J5705_02915 [Bacteroidaceae bacterium]|nr:hypothetical protein [Bacteroidaceae bacterium]
MKLFKLSYGLMVAAALAFVSCDINEVPSFDDADAFVAIQATSASISETGDTLRIPVMLTSLSGISGSVNFEITSDSVGGAIEGTHYTIANESKTLSFTKQAATQYIILAIIDNDTFGGDVKMTITLSDPKGVKLGANKTCSVMIEDDEHPLSFILGTLHAVGYDYFSGGAEEEWDATFAKDATDLNKVWIYGIASGGCSSASPVYGIVNADKTEIHIPVDQTTANTASYDVKLEGWYAPDWEEDIPTGGYITGYIAADGTITILDQYGAHAYNAGTTTSAGWYAIENGAVFKKQ